jgi:hypothetical protein
MGWARALMLGDVGNQLDIQDARAELDRLRRTNAAGDWKDREQDESLRKLYDENEQLKLCLGALVRLLVAKGSVSAGDVAEILNVLEPPHTSAVRGTGPEEPSNDDLIALADAARRFGAPR